MLMIVLTIAQIFMVCTINNLLYFAAGHNTGSDTLNRDYANFEMLIVKESQCIGNAYDNRYRL